MRILIWWTMTSVVVSLSVGAFLALGRRGAETTLDLDLASVQRAAPPAPTALPVETA